MLTDRGASSVVTAIPDTSAGPGNGSGPGTRSGPDNGATRHGGVGTDAGPDSRSATGPDAEPEAVAVPIAPPPVAPPAALARERASVPRGLHVPYAIVFAVAAGGLGWIWLGPGHTRAGLLVLASAMLAGALLRLVLPERRAGLLLSRRRAVDVLALATLGASIMAVVLVLPTPS